MTSDAGQAGEIGFALYRSTASRALPAAELREILAVARERNRSLGVTGCLHHEDGLFFQWLEGAPAAIEQVLSSIRRDDRHRAMVVLAEGVLPTRLFDQWQMRFSNREDASLLNWLASAEVSTLNRRDYGAAVTAFLRSVAI